MISLKELSLKYILGVAYFLCLSGIYVFILTGNYQYAGYKLNASNLENYYLSFLLYLFLLALIPKKLARPSIIFTWFYFFFVIAPAFIVSAFMHSGLDSSLAKFWLILVSMLLCLIVINRIPIKSFDSPLCLGESALVRCLVLSAFIANAYFLYNFGINAPANLLDVYDVRLMARDIIAHAPPGFGHILRFVSNVLNPLIIALGLSLKRWPLLLVGLIGQIVIFTLDATKSTLFSPVMILAFYFLLKSQVRSLVVSRFLLVIVGSILLLLLVDFLVFGFDGMWRLTYFFVRRFIFVPGHLSYLYFDFFSNWEYFGFASFFGGASNYPDYATPGFMLGDYVYGNFEGNVNVNLLFDGYARAGILGSVFSVTVFALFLLLYDFLSKNKDSRVVLMLALIPAFASINAGIATLFTTHGLGGIIFVMFIVGSTFAKRGEGRASHTA